MERIRMEASGTPAANEPPDEIGPEGGVSRARVMPIRPTEEPALEDEDTDEGNDEGESEEGGPDPFDINDFIYTPEELAEATEEGEGYTIDVGGPTSRPSSKSTPSWQSARRSWRRRPDLGRRG